ncbi:MAG TPA: hypothetical protein VLA16_00385 [Ideonella sp.]|nr:hypothetical protein [Ideonella sp.]
MSTATPTASYTTPPPDGPVLAPGAITLIGRPALLRGSVLLANRSAQKFKLKTATLNLKDGGSGDPHLPRQGLALQVSARLPPGAAAHAPLQLSLDARTPAGTYHGEAVFDALGETREAVLRVLEHRALSLRPSHFELYGRPGGSLSLPAVVTNLGNVAFTLPKASPLTLGEDNAFSALFHAAMARKGAEGHQVALDAFTELLAASEVESGRVVWAADGGKTLAPGESLSTELVFELPEKLSRRRAYVGGFVVGRAACSVELEVDIDEPAPPGANNPKPDRKVAR